MSLIPGSIIDQAAALVISFEKFTPKPFWDYKQWTNGYGTKAASSTEVVTKSVAKQRLLARLDTDLKRIEAGLTKPVSDNVKIALLSFGFNLGPAPMMLMVSRINLNNDLSYVAGTMNLYVNAGGQRLQGLVDRRRKETQIMLS